MEEVSKRKFLYQENRVQEESREKDFCKKKKKKQNRGRKKVSTNKTRIEEESSRNFSAKKAEFRKVSNKKDSVQRKQNRRRKQKVLFKENRIAVSKKLSTKHKGYLPRKHNSGKNPTEKVLYKEKQNRGRK
ncbi:hypothetical protein CEXT_267521 [Caerostris extrusa]|uniref:Uncharacterized protein n=1 Tax=Caerostris extrusa TaxID=172846 RepID=A0AAV4Q8Z6_CAEEX|nr:hypothetical protein CEXT_267521 [Caerostris extrusa]